MSYLNQVLLIGRIGQAPKVLKETQEGIFCKVRVCTTKKSKQKKEYSTWHTVYASNSLGKYVSSYFKTGDLVLINGELRVRDYDDKNGQKQVEVSVQAQECKLLSRKNTKPAKATNDQTDNDDLSHMSDEEFFDN